MKGGTTHHIIHKCNIISYERQCAKQSGSLTSAKRSNRNTSHLFSQPLGYAGVSADLNQIYLSFRSQLLHYIHIIYQHRDSSYNCGYKVYVNRKIKLSRITNLSITGPTRRARKLLSDVMKFICLRLVYWRWRVLGGTGTSEGLLSVTPIHPPHTTVGTGAASRVKPER